jgi:glycosyltransferase involved in cell wall biosynthesis
MKLLALLTDAFGGHGGIAQFNRDLLSALCKSSSVSSVTALPRLVPETPSSVPEAVDYRVKAAKGQIPYVRCTFRQIFQHSFHGVICGHLHLLPLSLVLARLQGVPVLLIVHGLEARSPSDRWLANQVASRVDAFVSVSHFTKQRFETWSGIDPERGRVIPNCIDRSRFEPGPKPEYLLERYGLKNRSVLLTLSRLPDQEDRKGHDEVLEALPGLKEDDPSITYLICGDGPDRARLEEKAQRIGLGDRVIFTGYVSEEEKTDHYRVADAFVMPGRTEGFGIVYLEAMVCGIPVVASSADASQEAVRHGELGVVVDPDDPCSVIGGIREALGAPRGVPDGLDYFSKRRFIDRWENVVDEYFSR